MKKVFFFNLYIMAKNTQLKLVDIYNISENFLVNSWYLDINHTWRSNLEYWLNFHRFNEPIIKFKMHAKNKIKHTMYFIF
jgi:hypothetical protein